MSGRAHLIGVGELPPSRDTGDATTLGLIALVASQAVAMAGIDVGRIDGLLTAPLLNEVPMIAPATVVEYLGLRVRRADVVDLGGATGAGMVLRARRLVESGDCNAVLCVTARTMRPGQSAPYGGREMSPAAAYERPYGVAGANPGYAMIARKHMHEYGTRGIDLAAIAVQQRFNAAHHPQAIHRKPITVDDVLTSPMIIDPLHLLEIVMPCGGAAAVLVANDEIASAARSPAVSILGAGEYCSHRSITYAPSLTESAVTFAARSAFEEAGTTAGEMDLLSLYDCYTITVLVTLEDIGLCAKGAGGSFVQEHDFRWCGDIPLNTHGGQLSFGQAGPAGGMSHVVEAYRQLARKTLGPEVKHCRLAYVNGNGGIMSEQAGLVLGV